MQDKGWFSVNKIYHQFQMNQASPDASGACYDELYGQKE